MSEMDECVARAIRKEITGMDDTSPIIGDGEDGVGYYMDIARAAIAAIEACGYRIVSRADEEDERIEHMGEDR